MNLLVKVLPVTSLRPLKTVGSGPRGAGAVNCAPELNPGRERNEKVD